MTENTDKQIQREGCSIEKEPQAEQSFFAPFMAHYEGKWNDPPSR